MRLPALYLTRIQRREMSAGAVDPIVRAVLDEFTKLPTKRKPTVRSNGVHEWVPLSGLVAQRRGGTNPALTCLSLATGMKCLPASKLPLANGAVLHDWHAEVLAIRAFNRFLLEECRNLALGARPSEFLRVRSREELAAAAEEAEADAWNGQPFAWKDDVGLHMYCSEAPCGDASMELIIAAQADGTPWDLPPEVETPPPNADSSLPGRAFFSQLGIVRRKPARGDAPPTLSKSCSDKLAMKQCTSLLSSVTSLLVSPKNVYLQSIILPETQYSSVACERAFSPNGRMKGVAGSSWPGGYSFQPFEIQTTSIEFEFSRRTVAARAGGLLPAASNLAVAWSQNVLEEGTLAGLVQGRKQTEPRAATLVSRRKMWEAVLEVSKLLGRDGGGVAIRQLLGDATTYREVKQGHLLRPRKRVKKDVKANALRGWASNTEDSYFGL